MAAAHSWLRSSALSTPVTSSRASEEKEGEAEMGAQVCCPQASTLRAAQDIYQALVLTGPRGAAHPESHGLSA